MSLIRRKPIGEVCPRGFGLCYRDRVNEVSVIAPLGLNVFIALAVWVYAWVDYGLPSFLDRSRP